MQVGVEVRQLRVFGCVQIAQRGPVSLVKDAEIIGAVQRHQQQKLPSARG